MYFKTCIVLEKGQGGPMLVLTRKIGDTIAIGDNIKIVVMAVKGKQVRLGIEADKSTIIHREEVYQKIQTEVKKASMTSSSNANQASLLIRKSSANSKTSFVIRKKNAS